MYQTAPQTFPYSRLERAACASEPHRTGNIHPNQIVGRSKTAKVARRKICVNHVLNEGRIPRYTPSPRLININTTSGRP
ncbi:uncharacterized [Tachysurus ichikawai]